MITYLRCLDCLLKYVLLCCVVSFLYLYLSFLYLSFCVVCSFFRCLSFSVNFYLLHKVKCLLVSNFPLLFIKPPDVLYFLSLSVIKFVQHLFYLVIYRLRFVKNAITMSVLLFRVYLIANHFSLFRVYYTNYPLSVVYNICSFSVYRCCWRMQIQPTV